MIETDICRGILLEEEKVPSTNELAKLYTINPATAAKGVNILVDEGILYKKRGIGMFVSKGAKDMILNKRKGAFYENYVKSLIEEAKKPVHNRFHVFFINLMLLSFWVIK